MKSEKALKKVLTAQLEGYKNLFDLLKKERACLIDFNQREIEEVSKEKDMLVLKLRLFEEERLRLIEKLIKEMKNSEDYAKQLEERPIASVYEVSLMDLSRITGDNDFIQIRLNLKSLIQGIEELNKFNKTLIDRSLSFIRNTNSFLKQMGVGKQKENIGTLLTKEA
ncbi:FlgN protein [Candidatus Magnetoovum chiemensis]|nr:FlgN protein [Candidatus Magnetoovum chiemensis]